MSLVEVKVPDIGDFKEVGVIEILVKPGDAVKKGDIVVVLEAMKMELPLRALGDGVVSAVRCREGELVHGDATLVEFA